MRNKEKGSITIFMSLMLMVTASLLFTLLEGSRYLLLGMMTIIESQSVTESMFAEYNVPAYENYHLFMMDSGYGTGELQLSKINTKMQELGQENLNPSVSGFGRYNNFLQMNVTDSSVLQYELATDQNGAALWNQISKGMKKELGMDMIKNTFDKITDVKESCTQGEKAEKCLDGALDTLDEAAAKEAEEARQEASTEESSGLQIPDTEQQETKGEIINPMEDVKSAKSSPLLAQILSGEKEISAKKISKEDAVENRTLNTGNYEEAKTGGLLDKVLLVQYLQKYMSNYRNKTNVPHALSYEQEYLLFGRYTDEDNLEKMAGRLLLLREGINFAYLLSDSIKREEALVAASAIAAAAVIPAAVSVIQMGLLASWAYAESIAELRTLFSGGKIAAVKTSESWTVNLSETASVLFNTSIKSKEVNSGVDYEEYLQMFLALAGTKKIGLRFANILEKNIRLYPGCEQVKLDCMITAMETNHVYQAQQVFLSLVTIEHFSKKGFHFEKKYKYSYIEEKDSS